MISYRTNKLTGKGKKRLDKLIFCKDLVVMEMNSIPPISILGTAQLPLARV